MLDLDDKNSNPMTFHAAEHYLNSLYNYETNFHGEKKFSLVRLKRILKILQSPEKKLVSIHVAGTKGKGSTSAMMASILTASGYKVGLYTSPHLYDFRERIRVGNQLISKRYVSTCIRRLIDTKHHELKKLLTKITYFEMMTLMAIMYFIERRIDIAVFEAGLGGRLDATNVINPRVSVLTLIGSEHKEVLGKTLKKRAMDKSMIIKSTSEVVTARQRKIVSRIILNRCRKFRIEPITAKMSKILPSRFEEPDFETFDVKTAKDIYQQLRCPLLGSHQIENATVAINALEAIKDDFPLTKKALYRGLREVRWPGRIEKVKKVPLVVIDSSHDKDSFKALFRTLKERFNYKRLILLIGLSDDKDAVSIARTSQEASEVIAVKTSHPRAMRPEKIARAFEKVLDKKVIIEMTPEKGLQVAMEKASKKDLIIIAGSFYLLHNLKPIIDSNQ